MIKNSIISLILEAIIFIAIIIFGVNYYNNKIETSDHNIKVYQSQIEELELKNGELITSRDSYIIKQKELEEMIGITQKEVRDLNKKLKSSLAYITQLESSIRIDTIISIKDTIIYRDNKTQINFEYTDKWVSFTGESIFNKTQSTTSIYDLYINVPIKLGLMDDYKIFVQSDNPYVNFSSIEGAIIDGSKLKPKKKKIGFSIQFGAGAMYDIIDKDIAIGPYGGAGLHINF